MRALFVRLFEALVVGFAALAFFKVPLGSRTAFEHALAIVATAPAKEAGRAFVSTVIDLRKQIAEAAAAVAGIPTAPDQAPSPTATAAPKPRP